MARPKGIADKRSKALEDAIRRRFPNYDPIIELIELSERARNEGEQMNVEFNCHKEVANYLLPKLKATEISVSDETIKNLQSAFPPVMQEVPHHHDAGINTTDT